MLSLCSITAEDRSHGPTARVAARIAVLAAVVLTGLGASSAMAAGSQCTGADVPTPGLANTVMHGTLCLPASGRPSTAMVLVPGATYNHTYWDFPYQPQTYNFREAMNAAGYATFVVDRLGTGLSSKPPSAAVTSSVEAAAVHGVIQALRHGVIAGLSFSKVILGGHSLGSAISIIEAATYHDENGVLLTGIAHEVSPALVSDFLSSLYPADLDPAFASDSYDPGYLTTRPGTRAADFYAPGTSDANVIAEDEATKDVFSAAEAPDGLGVSIVSPYSALIKAPVLIADGGSDAIFCESATGNCASAAALKASEAPYYGSTSCLQTYVLPGAGHDINLATNTSAYQRAVRDWADAFVGAEAGPVSSPPCGD